MFSVHSNNPSLLRWQARLARVPRWAWIAFFIGAVIPLVAFIIFVILTAFFFGAIVMGSALLIAAAVGFVRRTLTRNNNHRFTSNQIVIRSVRVVDP
jgi:hypothetical protein